MERRDRKSFESLYDFGRLARIIGSRHYRANHLSQSKKSACARLRWVPANTILKSATVLPFTSACTMVFPLLSNQVTLWPITFGFWPPNANAWSPLLTPPPVAASIADK